MSNSDRKALIPELQRDLAVENIAVKFVANGNHDDMIQGLRKLNSNLNSGASPPPAKKSRKQSNNQSEDTTNSAMIANNVNTSRPMKKQQNDASSPQKCKHCGKCVIHTDGIFDVYNVPSVHMASTGLRDTQNMSVMFDSTIFDNNEYMFANDLGIIDDLTLDKYLRLVAPSILASNYNELSDAESPPTPISPSPMYILDTAYVSPDPANVKECTRQLELYSRVAMEIQDVDAQPLYYGNKPHPGGVRSLKARWSKCHVYLKRGETLRVRRGERKTTHRV
jgi:hypothetical protein